MPKLLINKTMSRNGGTLICQLLENHSELFFPPFVFDLAISPPRCWPLSGFTEVVEGDFRKRMMDKISFWEGASWFEARNLPVTGDWRVNRELLRSLVSVNEFSESLIGEAQLEEAFFSFLAGVVEAYGEEASERLSQSEYFIIDADHSFVCGVSEALANFNEIRFMQVIRSVYDVVASRKNMLLHHAGIFGDPRTESLRENVVKSEASRWLLSVLSAVRDEELASTACVTIQFESLHRRRKEVMMQVADFFEIEFNESLLIEGRSEVDSITNKDSQFISSSSLLRVTQGNSSTVIGTHVETLNESEQETIADVLDIGPDEWPEAADIPEFRRFLKDFVGKREAEIHGNSFIQEVNLLPTSEKKMSAYSSSNFGRANVGEAFVS